MNPRFEELRNEAATWGDDSIQLIAEVDGCFLYEVLLNHGEPPGSRPLRYAVACVDRSLGTWSAWDTVPSVLDGSASSVRESGFPPEVMETFRKMLELLA